jgi:hypothetical protein
MTRCVIQGFFPGGRVKLAPTVAMTVQPKAGPRPPGPPVPAFVSRAPVVQLRGAADSFAVDPRRLGLVAGGGKPLPNAVRGQMEAALGADFSAVRVHVGPQAERIGAVAFTMGNDLYFAPGRFQPDTMQGKQLLGHELAHVVQQRAGRVRAPGGALAVVQDWALEAEADRLGRFAASHVAQRMAVHGPIGRSTPVSATLTQAEFGLTRLWRNTPSQPLNGTLQKVGSAFSPAIAGSVRGPVRVGPTIQRLTQIIYTQTNNRPGTDTIFGISHKRNIHNDTNRNIVAYLCGWNSYAHANANGCQTCNHYVAYSKIRQAVVARLEAAPATLNAAVAWLNGLALAPAAVVTVASTLFPPAQNPWNQPLGAMPAINIVPHHIALGMNYYDEEEVAQEVDDLIYNLANDPRNMFYWPTSTGQNAAGIDTPTGPLAHTPLATITARLAGYRVFLQGLGLAV